MALEIAGQVSNEAQEMHSTFWHRNLEEINKLAGNDFKLHELPLARIKKIMKLDEEVKMISAEAPVLFSKAAEIFISELSLRAWIHTEENKRRTLQRNDIAMAITKYDQFDFLIDIVPREEIKTTTKRSDDVQRTPVLADQVQYFFQLAQQSMQNQGAQSSSTPAQQPVQLQLGGTTIPAITIQPQTMGTEISAPPPVAPPPQPQVVHVQVPSGQTTLTEQTQPAPQQQTIQVTQAAPAPTPTPGAATAAAQPQGTTQVFQQVLTPSGDVQNVPIQLTPDQIQAITLQMQGKQPGQPILIQTGVQGDSQSQAEAVTDQNQYSTQPLFQVPLNIGGQQVFIQQSDSLQGDQGTIEIQDG